jgi:hypothetical protein
VAGSSGAVAQVLVCASNKDLPLAAPKTVRVYQGELHSSELSAYAGSLYIGDCSRFEGPVWVDKARDLHFALSCAKVNWPDSAFSGVTIKHSLFARANLPNLLLKNVDFSASDFSDADLSRAKFKCVDFSHCDFSGANLTDLYCDRVNFSGAVLSNARISLSPECIEESLRAPITRNQDLRRNGCVPEKGIGNLLDSIHSIDPEYQEQKNALMRSVIEHLHHVDDVALQRNLPPLVAVLSKSAGYGDADGTKQLLELWSERKQQDSRHPDEVDPNQVLNLVNRHPSGPENLVGASGKTLGLH